jgi:hypothetical protein
MPEMLSMLGALLMAMTVLGSWAQGAAPDSAANVGQVDINRVFLSTWQCPTPSGTTGTFFDVPGLALSITTTSGPVLVMVNFFFHGTANACFWFDPVIDKQQVTEDRLTWRTGNDGFVDVFSFHRVYALLAGTHTVSTRMSCQNGILVYRGWLTAYELPLVKSK